MKYLLILFIIFWTQLFAQEVNYLGRSPRALLMGDAYTAIADDEFTLFYNPAGLGKNTGVSFTFLDPTLGITDVLSELNRFSNFPSGATAAPAIASRLMDLPIYLQAGIFPNLKMGPFGFTLFANNKSSFVLRNSTNPELDINYNYDRGFIVGFAYNVGSGAFSTKESRGGKSSTSAGDRFSIGGAFKHMNRQGINNHFDFFGTTLLSKITAGVSDIAALKSALGYSIGSAWGYDLGAEYAISSGDTTFTSAFSVLDIGDSHFTKSEGTVDVPSQEMMVNSGVAFKQDFGLFDYTLSADMHPMTGMTDFARKFHFGAEVSLPLLTIDGGWSEGYLSYGVSIKLWPIKLTTGFYGVEVGSRFREQQAKRFILYLSLFDFSIDL